DTGNTCGGLQMADIGLHGTDAQGVCSVLEDQAQGAHFDRVTQSGASAVRFNIVHLRRGEVRIVQGALDDVPLRQGIWRRQAVTFPVLIFRWAPESRPDSFRIRFGGGEAFEPGDGAPLALGKTVSRVVKGTATATGGQGSEFGKADVRFRREN